MPGEILIGLKTQYTELLVDAQDPEPTNTGIPSIDALNEKWHVQQIVPLFKDVAPDDELAARYGLTGVFRLVVPADTDLRAMLEDYEADVHVDYAEENKPVEIK